ncbi:MAG: GspMb/PilO family protein [Vicinamibacteria bacterium]
MISRRSKIRFRIATAGAVLLAINLIAFAAITWPGLHRVRQAESRAQDIAVQRVALETLWTQLAARKTLAGQNRLDADALRSDYLKPRTEDLFASLREIEKLAVESGLRPKKSSYSIDKIPGVDLVRCTVTMPLDGTYANLTAFLARLETAKRFIIVEQMSLLQGEQAARMSLKLSIVFTGGGSDASE